MRISRMDLSVTYKDGSRVYHQSKCRAATRIKTAIKATRRQACDLGLTPCRNCERNA